LAPRSVLLYSQYIYTASHAGLAVHPNFLRRSCFNNQSVFEIRKVDAALLSALVLANSAKIAAKVFPDRQQRETKSLNF
jgi:hypothetical protein